MEQALSTRLTHSSRNRALTVLVGWFLLALLASLLGVFDSEQPPPIPLGLAVVVPVVLFAFCYRTSAAFREFILLVDLRLLTVTQTWRVIGISFLILHQQGALPGVFALPAGWGDIAIGITAPVIAMYWRQPFPRKTFIVWNLLGIVDLVLAVTLGILSSGIPVGVLAGDVTTRLMGRFPLSLVPTFFVPMFLIFHLISLIRVRKEAF